MSLELKDGSRVAVVGGGPAGAFAAYFLLDLAARVGLDLRVEVFEAKDFDVAGPTGCNHCGGIISESLVQLLAAEGIMLPSTVVQRALDAYVLHADVGSVTIETPLHEMRIGAVHRGGGPRGVAGARWDSFDGHLLGLARSKGAEVVRARVERLGWQGDRPRVEARGRPPATYDLLVAATGVNSALVAALEGLGIRYRAPRTAKTIIAEYHLGAEAVTRSFGTSMHVFLTAAPNLEFAAIVPKGDVVTLCMLGTALGRDDLRSFLYRPEVRACFPPGWVPAEPACQCGPRINVGAAAHPFGDRVVVIGDGGVARLYKDGIGSAYRTAKASALVAIFSGVSGRDFARKYRRECRRIARDNRLGRLVFAATGALRHARFLREALLETVRREQSLSARRRHMSGVLWDTFTGSAPYADILRRSLHPALLARLGGSAARAWMSSVRHPG